MSDKSRYVLVTYHDNWSDEIDGDGYFLGTRKDWETWLSIARKVVSPDYSFDIGTNEEVVIEKGFKELQRLCSLVELTDEEAKTVVHLFALAEFKRNPTGPWLCTFGVFNVFAAVASDAAEQQEEEGN